MNGSRTRDGMAQAEQDHTPGNCPSCGSRDLMTTSKVATSSSYWRCGGCGEIWNIERLRQGSRYSSRRVHYGG
jgi:transposase-like protein